MLRCYEAWLDIGYNQVLPEGTDASYQFRMTLLVTEHDITEEHWAYDDLTMCCLVHETPTMTTKRFDALPMLMDVVKGDNRSAFVGSIVWAPPMGDEGYEIAQVTGYDQVPPEGTDMTYQFRMTLLVTGREITEERWAYDDLTACRLTCM